MRYRYFATTSVAFLVMVVTGGIWLGFTSRIAPGQPGLVVTLLGGAFSLAFLSLLIVRLRSLLAHPERRLLEGVLLLLNLAILIVAFAWVHHRIGIMDFSGSVPRPTRDFGDALYFSVVTSTTLGFGDFIPLGPGRPVAALQALVGYLTLGILVSTGFQVLSPGSASDHRDRPDDRDHRDDCGDRT